MYRIYGAVVAVVVGFVANVNPAMADTNPVRSKSFCETECAEQATACVYRIENNPSYNPSESMTEWCLDDITRYCTKRLQNTCLKDCIGLPYSIPLPEWPVLWLPNTCMSPIPAPPN